LPIARGRQVLLVGSMLIGFGVCVVAGILSKLHAKRSGRLPAQREPPEAAGGQRSGSRAMATVTVLRGSSWVDHLREYFIECDGVRVGAIKRDSRFTFEVQPGLHDVRATIDWAPSNRVKFAVAASEQVELEVASSLRGWRVVGAVVMLFIPNRWLTLRQSGGAR
jgi:hypothetical protein